MSIDLERVNSAVRTADSLIKTNETCIAQTRRLLRIDLGVLSGWTAAFGGVYLASSEYPAEVSVLGLITQVGVLTTGIVCGIRYSKKVLLEESNLGLQDQKQILEEIFEMGKNINRYPEILRDKQRVVHVSNLPMFTTTSFEN